MTARCDICYQRPVSHEVPTRDFALPWSPEHRQGTLWLACSKCATHIERGEWARLHQRAGAFIGFEYGRPLTEVELAGLEALYALLRKNITGPVRRIGSQA